MHISCGAASKGTIVVPEIPGYTANGVAPSVVVTPDTQSSVVDIKYVANDSSQTISYRDPKDGEVSKQVIPGKTDQTVDVTPEIPDGYVAVDKVPGEVTIKASDDPIVINIKHGTTQVDPDKPVNPGNLIPDTKDKHFPAGLTHDDLNKTVTRTVNITDPHTQKVTTTNQEVTFKRGATVDKVTLEVTYDDWSEGGKHEFAKVDVPEVPSYTASGDAPQTVVTPDSKNETIDITYVANSGKQTIIYRDATYGDVGTQAVDGKTDDKVKVEPKIPDGYVPVDSVPTEVVIKAQDDPIIVSIKHGTTRIEPNAPVEEGSLIPGTEDKHFPAGLTHDDLNKTVTRTVNITDPHTNH